MKRRSVRAPKTTKESKKPKTRNSRPGPKIPPPIRVPLKPTTPADLPKNVVERIMLMKDLHRITRKMDLSALSRYAIEGPSLERTYKYGAYSEHKWRRLMHLLDPAKLYDDYSLFNLARWNFFDNGPEMALEQARYMLRTVPKPPRDVVLRFLVKNLSNRYRSNVLLIVDNTELQRYKPVSVLFEMFLNQLLSHGPSSNSFASNNERDILTLTGEVVYAFACPSMRKTGDAEYTIPRALANFDRLVSIFPSLRLDMCEIAIARIAEIVPLLKQKRCQVKRHISIEKIQKWIEEMMRRAEKGFPNRAAKEDFLDAVFLRILEMDDALMTKWFLQRTGIDIQYDHFRHAIEIKARHSAKALVDAGFTAFSVRPPAQIRYRTRRNANNANFNSNLENNNNLEVNNLNVILSMKPTATRTALLNRLLNQHPHLRSRLIASYKATW